MRTFMVQGLPVQTRATRRRYMLVTVWSTGATIVGYGQSLASSRKRARQLGAVVIDLEGPEVVWFGQQPA